MPVTIMQSHRRLLDEEQLPALVSGRRGGFLLRPGCNGSHTQTCHGGPTSRAPHLVGASSEASRPMVSTRRLIRGRHRGEISAVEYPSGIFRSVFATILAMCAPSHGQRLGFRYHVTEAHRSDLGDDGDLEERKGKGRAGEEEMKMETVTVTETETETIFNAFW